MRSASVIGSGPNGLAAAIELARSGFSVDVYEAEEQIGGASRTLPLTLPGFGHDFGSAVHPMAAGSPFFSSLPLHKYGLEWVHGPAPLAHPLDDGTAVVLERDLNDAVRSFDGDGRTGDGRVWKRMVEPFATRWPAFADEILGPVPHLPRHPFLLARFGLQAALPATVLSKLFFRSARVRALFAGLAAHSFLSLDAPLSSAVGIVLAATAHAVGWPVPRGGAQAIPDALAGHLQELGGQIHRSRRITSIADFGDGLILCDVSPRQLLSIAGSRLTPAFQQKLTRFKPGPGVFKIDYALSEPIPWTASDCRRAICIHLGGSFEEIARSESAMAKGRISGRPFMILAQPTLFDSTRAPQGKHTAWVYCHVPNGCTADMTQIIESQIERFAPGFRDCVLARHVFTPAMLESSDANLIGGDISGGGMSVGQMLFRPSLSQYATSDPNLYLCSASTPPGGGVHGMCGHHAAELAIRRNKNRK